MISIIQKNFFREKTFKSFIFIMNFYFWLIPFIISSDRFLSNIFFIFIYYNKLPWVIQSVCLINDKKSLAWLILYKKVFIWREAQHFIFFNFINLNVSVNDLIGHTARLSSPEFYSDDRGVRTQGFTFLSLRDLPQGILAPILKM